MIRIIYQNIIITDRPLCKSFEWCKIEIKSIFMSFINNNKILCKVCSSWYEHSLMLSVEAQWLLSSSAVRKEDTVAKDTRHCLVICSNYQRHKTLSCNLFELEKEKVASASWIILRAKYCCIYRLHKNIEKRQNIKTNLLIGKMGANFSSTF